jgi:hypothetical protein
VVLGFRVAAKLLLHTKPENPNIKLTKNPNVSKNPNASFLGPE